MRRFQTISEFHTAWVEPCRSISDRSGISRPPADISDGVPPSRSPFAIAVSPVGVNHAIPHRATRFWVRPSKPGDYYWKYIVTLSKRGRLGYLLWSSIPRIPACAGMTNNVPRLPYSFRVRPTQLLDDNLAVHPRVRRTNVIVNAGLREGDRP